MKMELDQQLVEYVDSIYDFSKMKLGRDFRKHQKDCHAFIPYSDNHFIFTLKYVLKRFKRKYANQNPYFVDAGCGNGCKCVIAKILGCNYVGIEIQKSFAKFASDLLGCPLYKPSQLPAKFYSENYHSPNAIIIGDISDHDYSYYDIVFYYRPIFSKERQSIFEQRVHKTMKKGAYLLCAFPALRPSEKQFKYISDGIGGAVSSYSHLTVYQKL